MAEDTATVFADEWKEEKRSPLLFIFNYIFLLIVTSHTADESPDSWVTHTRV